jgi:hypothetical protein
MSDVPIDLGVANANGVAIAAADRDKQLNAGDRAVEG